MATYRLYCLSGTDHIIAAEWIEANDDYEAMKAARALKMDVHCELWLGTRKIAEIPPFANGEKRP